MYHEVQEGDFHVNSIRLKLIITVHDQNHVETLQANLNFNSEPINSKIMIYQLNHIEKQSYIPDIVNRDYRTASVFRKYGIDFCCGAKLPLEAACNIRGIDADAVKDDLERVTQNLTVSNMLRFDKWGLGFLADYIVHIHHDYLRAILPEAMESLKSFTKGHQKKYGYLLELTDIFCSLANEMLVHIAQEEEVIFPYIKQIEHAYENRESYASLLVRTLSKPVEDMRTHEHEVIVRSLNRIRELTNNYESPANACTSHKVNLLTLEEIDNDLIQHLHLENNILFPKAIKMEQELLQHR
ncbi:MAG: hypothetical protein C5B59_03665 [Bacteroidetes bacterium]|nr:MAG: hypothetical protein C5B59_03665 [Bacteroidota bacterium]